MTGLTPFPPAAVGPVPNPHAPFRAKVVRETVRTVARLTVLLGLSSGSCYVDEGVAQTSGPPSVVRLVEVHTEPAVPPFGEAFNLHFTLRLEPGRMAFLPDTLVMADAVQSLGPGSWHEVQAPGDSVEIRATYPVIGFREGRVGLPWLEVWVRPADLEPGDRHVVQRMTPLAVAAPGVTKSVIRLGAKDIGSLTAMNDEIAELVPRPPADVLGGTWSLWLLLALGVTIVTIGGAGAVFLPRWWASRGAAWWARRHGRSPRQEAMRELVRIRSSQWHRNDRVDEFYACLTDTLRHFVHRMEPTWGPALTSSEILARMEQRWGVGGLESIAAVVTMAERVKFGGHRPEPDGAEADWTKVHDWIRVAPEA